MHFRILPASSEKVIMLVLPSQGVHLGNSGTTPLPDNCMAQVPIRGAVYVVEFLVLVTCVSATIMGFNFLQTTLIDCTEGSQELGTASVLPSDECFKCAIPPAFLTVMQFTAIQSHCTLPLIWLPP